MIETVSKKIITSAPLTVEQAGQLHSEFDQEFEKEFRKYESFYAYGFVEIDSEMVAYAKEEFGVDISDQIGMAYSLVGMWSDSDGTDWSYATLQVAEEVYVPEQVVITPARIDKIWSDYKGI